MPASLSKAHGGPGLRTGWLTTAHPELMRRLIRFKMNSVISHSVVDEALAVLLFDKRADILGERAQLLASGLDAVARFQTDYADAVDWVRPNAGGMCCFRLRPDALDAAAVERFYASFEAFELQLANGEWFGDDRRVFRLGFGFPPPERLGPALEATARALEAARKG